MTNLNPLVIRQLKREHQQNLIVCSNIRAGFTKCISLQRIKSYTDWYWQNLLLRHFKSEERDVFPVLGMDNKLIKKAIAEHRRLKRLFENKSDLHRTLNRIEEELEAHVRFEHWVLFREIEKTGTKKETAAAIVEDQTDEGPVWPDEFWK